MKLPNSNKYISGGFVPGRVNKGEIVITKSQQKRLYDLIDTKNRISHSKMPIYIKYNKTYSFVWVFLFILILLTLLVFINILNQ